MLRVTVWGENVHEKSHKIVSDIYPKGMHGCIADALNTDPEIKARTAILEQPEHGLTAPIGLAVATDGRMLVSERGTSMQVAVFGADGELQRRIGSPGGRPLSGSWKAEGMLMPRGIACDASGHLWVAEEDFAPRRISVWDTDGGNLIRDFIGRSSYGATGAAVNADDPTMAVDTGTIFTLDWATGSAKPAYTLPRQGVAAGAMFGWPYPGDGTELFAKERFVRHQGRQYLLRETSPMQVLELVDGRWLLRAAFGHEHGAFAFQITQKKGIDVSIFAPFPGYDGALWSKATWPPPAAWRNRAFIWCDRDGDGLVQTEEVERSDTIIGAWGGDHPMFSDDLTVLLGAHALAPTGTTPCGAPLYRMADIKQVVRPAADHPNGWGIRMRTTAGWLIADGYRSGNWRDGREPPGLLTGYAPDGERRWFYPSWFNVHGSQLAPPPRPGRLVGNWYFGGQVDLGGDVGEVVHMMGNVGQHFLFTVDGLYLAALFRDDRSGAAVPSVIHRGDRIDGMSNESEGWCSGFFRNAIDDRIYVLSSPAHASGPVISEVHGLDQVRRIAGGAIDITPAVALRARELPAAGLDGSLAPMRIASIATPPVIDGGLGEWDMAAGIGIPVDEQRGARVAMARDDSWLYLAYAVRDPNGFANHGKDQRLLFKSGGAVDLMLGTQPAASPGRPQPVAGDMRLLFAAPDGVPAAILYRAVDAGATDGTSFSSPQCRVDFDSVRSLTSARVAVQRASGGFTLEAAISFVDLGWTPKGSEEIRGDVGVIYGDVAGTRNIMRTYWRNRDTGLVSDVGEESRLAPSRWGPILVEGR